MKRGIALLNANSPASLAEALALFDEALTLRRGQRTEGDHWASYLLAASWMNRADALTRLGAPAQLAEAVRSYDEALAALRDVPLDVSPLYRRRQAIAWINRGQTLHVQATDASIEEAIRSFDQGIAAVREHPEHRLLLACAWVNRGTALLATAPAQVEAGQTAAQEALSLLKESQESDRVAAEASLKAHLVICRAMAERLEGECTSETALELACDATDAVEEGLRLARHWEASGEAGFPTGQATLFRFGLACINGTSRSSSRSLCSIISTLRREEPA